MNVIFSVIFIACAFLLLCHDPDLFLTAMIDGGAKAASTCIALIATYSVWMGLIRIWEDCGIARGVAKLVKPLARKILKTNDEEALLAASMNISVNLLGISGAATPYGIKTAKLLDQTENAEFSSAMFFVLNATSLQILPASMVAVRASMGSLAPADIILPTLLTTALSTLIGVVLTMVLLSDKKQKRDQSDFIATMPITKRKTHRAGTR